MTKKHYFLVAGSVVFHDPEGNIGQVSVNAIVFGETADKIPVRMIGKAQQAVQMQFIQKMNDTSIQIVDVFIMNLMHLGHMTEAEFNFRKPDEALPITPAVN